MSNKFNDYGFDWPQIETPLSYALGLPPHLWEKTLLARLNKISRQFWLQLPDRDDQHVWRVVDAFLAPEDTMMTRFWAYGPQGEAIAHPAFLVMWPSGRHEPVDGQFMTARTGGYKAEVKSRWPSELFSFGHVVHSSQTKIAHNCLVIVWRLMAQEDYDAGKARGDLR